MAQQERRGPTGSLLPPVEQVRQRLSIATAIFTAGLVDGYPAVDAVHATTVAAFLIASTTTQEALDQIADYATAPRRELLEMIVAQVGMMRDAVTKQENGRLAAEAKVYAEAFRGTATKIPLPPNRQ